MSKQSKICDVENERQLLGDALMKANASRAIWRSDAGAARAEVTRASMLAQKLVHTLIGWAGTRSDLLRDFGLTPHKERRTRSAHSGAAGTPGHTRTHKAAAHTAAGGGGGGGEGSTSTSTPTPTDAEGSFSSGK